MGTTRSQVERWDTAALAAIGADTDTLVERIDKDAATLFRTIQDLDWSGAAYRAADARADHEQRQLRRVGSAFDALGQAARAGAAAMQPMLDNLRGSVRNLTGDGFAVADDWTVTDSSTTDDDVQRAERTSTAVNETVRLQRLAGELTVADEACARAIASADAEIAASVPVVAGLSSAAGADLDAIRAGHPTPDQLARLRAATELSPDDLQRLARGESIDLPAGRMDYLVALMRALDGSSVSQLADVAEHVPGLADALQLASNPQVQTAGSLESGSARTPLGHGGMDQLPAAVRSLLTESPVVRPETADPPRALGIDIRRAPDFARLAELVGSGDRRLAHGSDLDRGLLKQAAEIAGATRGAHLVHTGGTQLPPDQLDSLLDGMLGAAAGDHTAVHDFATGHGMGVTVDAAGRYNAADHVGDLLRYPWPSERHGAQQMFDWLSGPDATSPDPAMHQRAAETASAVAHVLADRHQMLAPAGIDEPALGEVNPELTRTLARGVAPYLADFAGASNPLAFGPVYDLANLFRTLDTDPGAAQIVTGAGAQWVNLLAYENGMQPDGPALGNTAGLLSHAMHDGLTARLTDLRDAQRWDAIVDYNRQSRIFDSGAGAVGFVPGIGMPAVIATPFVKPLFLDVPNNPADLAHDDSWTRALAPLQPLAQPDSTITNYYLIDGYAQTHPEIRAGFTDRHEVSFFNADGHLDWDRMNADPGWFNRAKNGLSAPALSGFRQDFQDGLTDSIIRDTNPGPRPPR